MRLRLTHPLDAWQELLTLNFTDVTLRKLELPQEPVTFALEHGLSEVERSELNVAILESVAQKSLRIRHYACWAAYAAELGYLFAGDEYWHTFESQTPKWHPSNRPFIKSCFVKFAEEYNGATPEGTWAHHFSIICWPITHSILPKDLQRQMAEILYRIRHSVVVEDVESPSQLGRLIARHSGNTTSRFQQLSSDPNLIGQIAAALLLDTQSLNLIESQTLSRIAADLNLEGQARSWLEDARSHLSRRVQIKGLRNKSQTNATTTESSSRPPRPPLRPRLLLHCKKDDQWRLLLDVPDLTALVRTYPELQAILTSARVRIGSLNRSIPAQALLHGSQKYAETTWPDPNTPLLKFEPSHRDLDALLEHSCTIGVGPWLFRVGVDGNAWEIRSKRVAIGGNYIVVGSAELFENLDIGRSISLDCTSVIARYFTATSLEKLKDVLGPLGLDGVRKVSVQPVGIVPANWDQEGTGEWLTGDQPLLILSANYAIDHFDVSINIGTEELNLEVAPLEPIQEVILQLPQLHAGIYFLSIKAHPLDATYAVEQGEMEVVIRDPVPSGAKAKGSVAMLVIEEPIEASMQDVFDGGLNVQVIGPPSRDINVTIRLLSKQKVQPLFKSTLTNVHLPIEIDQWAKHMNRLESSNNDFAKNYQEADSCEFTFDGGDLGMHRSTYHRPFSPLRWGVTHSRNKVSIILYDNTDNPQDIVVVRYEFATPLLSTPVSSLQRQEATQGDTKPGLYVARTDTYVAATIVPNRSIAGLKSIRPRFSRPERSMNMVAKYLDSVDAWGHASTTGNIFGRYAWRQSFKGLMRQLAGLIGGTPWFKAEMALENDGKGDFQSLANYIPYKHYGTRWPRELLESANELSWSSIEERVGRLGVITAGPIELCQFALRLSSDPTDIRHIYGNDFPFLLREIMQKSEFLRAARFIVLLTNYNSQITEF